MLLQMKLDYEYDRVAVNLAYGGLFDNSLMKEYFDAINYTIIYDNTFTCSLWDKRI